MIVAIRTDKPVSEIYLLDEQGEVIAEYIWESGNKLSEELLAQVERLLEKEKQDLKDISAVIVYTGPGSFTGLRIGITIANSIAYANQIPISGSSGQDWLQTGFKKLSEAKAGGQVLPVYGRNANITKPRK